MNIVKLLKTELINTKRPPTIGTFHSNYLAFSISSSIISQSLLFNFLKCIGIP
jgi:hypothetical protein